MVAACDYFEIMEYFWYKTRINDSKLYNTEAYDITFYF